ncbi:jerky-like protein [Trichonephila inaurata madagascariensis]|uniref:Jerky-like protein n=1 Tax=Trichonephila inaurata madagascariensis TaxID=2747483 RepID=A0A8X7C5T2_9ARAC|nr:jerky-like protein [Trichonephila inaurata madagascariensis]
MVSALVIIESSMWQLLQICAPTLKDTAPTTRTTPSAYVSFYARWKMIRELQIESESLCGDNNSAHKFKETVLQHVEEEGYPRDDVYNVDETGVNWKAQSRKPMASKRESTAPGL